MEKTKYIEDLPEETPRFLKKIKKENHFTIPKNYFKSLPQLISDKKLKNKSVENIFDKLSYQILTPTIGTLTLVAIFYFYQPQKNNTSLTTEQLSEIILNEELIEIDENLVYEVYTETENTFQNKQNTNEEIIDYLINDNININLIIEEL